MSRCFRLIIVVPAVGFEPTIPARTAVLKTAVYTFHHAGMTKVEVDGIEPPG